MEEITIDGLEEGAFRRAIEQMLRHGHADEAAEKLKELLAEYCGEGRLLPARFLTVTAADITIAGWDGIGAKLGEYDRPEQQISALHLDTRDPLEVGRHPDDEGRLAPFIETNYFSDSAYPFTEADREDLLEGYSVYGCEWQGNFEQVDTALSIDGIDDLYGTIVELEERVAASDRPELDDIRAGALGACYVSVLIHQALQDAARNRGLPRPLCVLAGSSDAYPFFDAPVMTCDEYQADGVIGRVDSEPHPLAFDDDEELSDEMLTGGVASLETCGLIKRTPTNKKAIVFADAGDAAAALYESSLAGVEAFSNWNAPPLSAQTATLGSAIGEPLPPEDGRRDPFAEDSAIPVFDAGEGPPDNEPEVDDYREDIFPEEGPGDLPGPPSFDIPEDEHGFSPPQFPPLESGMREDGFHPTEPAQAADDISAWPPEPPFPEPDSTGDIPTIENDDIGWSEPPEQRRGSAIRRQLIASAPPPETHRLEKLIARLERFFSWIKRS